MRLEPIGNPLKEEFSERMGDLAHTLSGWMVDYSGGRNLLLGTGEITTAPPGATKITTKVVPEGLEIVALPDNSGSIQLNHLVTLVPGVTFDESSDYVFSFEVKSPDSTLPPRFSLGSGWYTGWSDMVGTISSDGFRQVYVTRKPYSSAVTGTFPQLGFAPVPGTYIIRGIKLEKGSRPTPWTPAPEDALDRVRAGLPAVNPIPPSDPALKMRVDDSVGSRVFVGNTMIHGDTGWRDITSEVTNGWTARSMVVRRIGSMVDFRVSGLDATNAAGNTFLYMPPVFAPGPEGKLTLLIKHVETHGSNSQMSLGDTTGTINNIFRSSVTTRFALGSLSITYFVSEPWPTSLPGTPA